MSAGARRSLVALCVLLGLLGLLQPDRSREYSRTTYGTTPVGYGAVLALLVELGLPAGRTFAPVGALPSRATIWWILPEGLCRPAAPADATPEPPWAGAGWLAAGGTAVVFLGGESADACADIAGVAVPARSRPAHGSDEPDLVDQTVEGALVPAPRILPLPALRTFDAPGDWTVRASLDGRPFVLATAVGAGQLVLVADAAPLRNQWLDRGDAAVFAVDLVRAYGVPRIDERHHGMHLERGVLRYLLRSPAVPALLGILLLGLLVVWHGHLWPPRTAAAAGPPAPTLTAFVDSLAQLYARTGDHARVAERYRHLTAARLRRHFGLPAETPLATLLDRLRASRRALPATALAPLAAPTPVTSAETLGAAVRALDALVEDSTR